MVIINRDQLKEKFKKLETLADVAELLGTTGQKLAYILYREPNIRDSYYVEYTILKKSGGVRQIAAPKEPISIFQSKLAKILQRIVAERPSAHGFTKGKSIKSNANIHKNRNYVFNVDLEDFFPSINFGRVRGMFMAKPYSLPESVATILAQITCYKNAIPQGAASSPVISNMLCSKLDGQLQRLAKENRCTYTRYADDITFSTNLKNFPLNLAKVKDDKILVSKQLAEIIEENGFVINLCKVRLQTKEFRQEVTGLVVNDFVNVKREFIRNVRSALHQWEKNGITSASDDYFEKYCPASKNGTTKNFKKVIRGKIEYIRMIRSSDEPKINSEKLEIFYRLLEKYHLNCLRDFSNTVVRTEGKTDWMHFEKAFEQLQSQGKFKDKNISFYKTKDHFFYGSTNQLAFCQRAKREKYKSFHNKIICIFDSDEKQIKSSHGQSIVKAWGENVYSVLIPNKNGAIAENICVELLYDDQTLKNTVDGRRMYLSNEFNMDGSHKTDKNLKYAGNLNDLKGHLSVIDDRVINIKTGNNIALPKNLFAVAIYKRKNGFQNIDVSAFEKLFEKILEIS